MSSCYNSGFTQREPPDIIEVQLIIMPSVDIEHVADIRDLSCSIAHLIIARLNYFHLFTRPD